MMKKRDAVKSKLVKDLHPQPSLGSHLPLLGPKLKLYQEVDKSKVAHSRLVQKGIETVRHKRANTWNWNVLEKNKIDLKELFLNSNNSVNENKASISRFFEIIRDQQIQKEKIKWEILSTELEVAEYKKTKKRMEEYVEQYSIFETFLGHVAEQGQDFNSVRDILDRYQTLEATGADCSRILEAEMESDVELRKQMIDVLEENSSELKGLSNRLVMLQVARKEAKDHRLYWEHVVQRLKQMVLAREEEAIVLRGACWDLYHQMCLRRKIQPSIPHHDMNTQLDFIQKSITFFKDVSTIATGTKTGNSKSIVEKVAIKKRMKSN